MERKALAESIEEKLEYIGLNLEKIPASLKKVEPLQFRVPKFYDEKQYKQYRYIQIKDIQILLSPTNRLDEIEKKYKHASPLADYLDNKHEKNLLKYTTFLNMLKQIKIPDIEKVEEEQYNLNRKIPFKVKFEGNYLWQIYYSEATDKYFMLVPTEDSDYSTFFYLLKKKLEKRRTAKIFVPIRNVEYSNEILRKSQFEDLVSYLWLFTKDWPLVYEVYDENDELSIQIIGETNVYEKIKSPYKIVLKNKKEARQFFRLIKAMFILQTELPNYFNFTTNINNQGGIEFYFEDKQIKYSNIVSWITKEYIRGIERISSAKEKIEIGEEKLEKLKIEVATQEIEYLAKEKQITTFLECKKSFFGKFKYYFKYNKKKNKGKIKGNVQEKIEDETNNNKIEIDDKKFREKDNYTIEELLELYKEFEKIENTLKNITQDINSLKLKKKNMTIKIKNATAFIDEIDSHKKSIFEFWRYSNKDEVAVLPEGEKEEINIIKKVEKVFDYEEDLEKFGKIMDKIQRRNLSKKEKDSIYITSTDLIEILNKVKNNNVVPKEITASLKVLKNEAIKEKILLAEDDYDIFGGISQDSSKVTKINNKKHRENPKDRFNILDINKTTKQIGYKLALEEVAQNVKKALEKVVISDDIVVYKAIGNTEIDKKEFNVFDMNPENEIKEKIKKEENINFYKINLKKGSKAISFTNCIFYDNKNKTLPIGQDLSSKILVDLSETELKINKKTSFNIAYFEDNKDDFSEVIIKNINVFECED